MQGESAHTLLEGATVREAMVTSFATLPPGATLDDAAQALLATSQQDFPVALGTEVVGMVSRERLLHGLAREGKSAYVTEVMERDLLRAAPDEPLEPYLARPDGLRRAPILVLAPDGRLVGVVTQENVMEFLMLRRIAQQAAPA